MAPYSTYQYNMWQVNNLSSNGGEVSNTPPSSSSCLLFDVRVQVHHVLESEYTLMPLAPIHKSYPLPLHLFFPDDDRAFIIDTILSLTGVSRDFIDTVTPDISSFALDIIINNINNNNNDDDDDDGYIHIPIASADDSGEVVLTMVLDIFVITHYDELGDIDLALRQLSPAAVAAAAAAACRFKPASKPSIEGLKRVKIGGLCSITKSKCVICLEEFLIGDEAVCLPCGHCSFHGGCIVRWLETSHLCPLCRFTIP